MNDTDKSEQVKKVMCNIDHATIAFGKQLQKLRVTMGDAYDFMRGWAALDPAIEPMIKAFTDQFERSDDFRFKGVMESLRLSVAGDPSAGILAAMGLMAQAKKLRDPENAPSP